MKKDCIYYDYGASTQYDDGWEVCRKEHVWCDDDRHPVAKEFKDLPGYEQCTYCKGLGHLQKPKRLCPICYGNGITKIDCWCWECDLMAKYREIWREAGTFPHHHCGPDCPDYKSSQKEEL